MNDTKEIVLFFANNQTLNTTAIANEMKERYPELNDPIIIPKNDNNKAPLIIFNSNPDFQIQVSALSLNFIISHTYFNKLAAMIFDFVDLFDGFNIKFVRIGYIANLFLSPKNIIKVKNKYLNMDNLGDIGDFNISWYRKLESEIGVINCWERILTDSLDFKDLLIQYDFNTPADKVLDFNMKFIKEFIKTTNDYIGIGTDF